MTRLDRIRADVQRELEAGGHAGGVVIGIGPVIGADDGAWLLETVDILAEAIKEGLSTGRARRMLARLEEPDD